MIRFISITSDTELAQELWRHDGHWVMVDLEREGKKKRQPSGDSVLSDHTLDDVARLCTLTGRGEVLVRIDPLGDSTPDQVNRSIACGVDRIMLPMFRTRDEVDSVVEEIDGRVHLTLLAETDTAIQNLSDIISGLPSWVDHVHIGFRDLSLDREGGFLFEPLGTGEVQEISRIVHRNGLRFGFGGIGAVGTGVIPPERLIGEHVRLGSTAAILARSFYNVIDTTQQLQYEIEQLRRFEQQYARASERELGKNRDRVRKAVHTVVQQINSKGGPGEA